MIYVCMFKLCMYICWNHECIYVKLCLLQQLILISRINVKDLKSKTIKVLFIHVALTCTSWTGVFNFSYFAFSQGIMYFFVEFVDTQSLDMIPEVWFVAQTRKNASGPLKSGTQSVYEIRVISSPSCNRHYIKAACFMKL